MEFNDVHYWDNGLHILKGAYGKIDPNKLLVILGSSGSGKTTLLDCLAQRKISGGWTGTILYNGKNVYDSKKWKQKCGYVLQHDRLLSCSTVFECLMFSSRLRSFSNRSGKEYHVNKVERVLDELSLSHRRNSRIGSEDKKVLSGGEIRRVSIGLELVAECEVLLTDEPTSGVDSSTALNIVKLLKKLSRNGRVVAATLHQPSSSINNVIDDLILMSRGEVCYAGPYSKLLSHFESIGFTVPPYMNPTDFIMELSHDPEKSIKMVTEIRKSYAQLNDIDRSHEISENEPEKQLEDENVYQAPVLFQIYILWLRNFRQFYRDTILLSSEILQYIIFGIFIGLLFYRLSFDCEIGTFDRLSAIFFILTSVCFVPSFTVIESTAGERALFLREIKGGLYNLSSSYIAKMLVSWPFELLLTVLFSVCLYFLAGFQRDVDKVLIFFLLIFIFSIVSETLGLICAVVTKTATMAVLLLSLVLVVCLALGGFLFFKPKPGFMWFEKINFFVFATTALQRNEFDGLVLNNCRTNSTIGLSQELIKEGRIRNDYSRGANIAILTGILVFLRIAAYILTRMIMVTKVIKRSENLPSFITLEDKNNHGVNINDDEVLLYTI